MLAVSAIMRPAYAWVLGRSNLKLVLWRRNALAATRRYNIGNGAALSATAKSPLRAW